MFCFLRWGLPVTYARMHVLSSDAGGKLAVHSVHYREGKGQTKGLYYRIHQESDEPQALNYFWRFIFNECC